MQHMTLREEVATNNMGYTTIRSGTWDIAFAARNEAGYINIKVRHNEFDKFVVFGYLDIQNWEAKTNRWCKVRDPAKVAEVKATVNRVFNGLAPFAGAPNPRGKPPGAKSTGGYQRKSEPRTETPREEPRARSGIANDIAEMEAELHARRREVDMLRQAMLGLEHKLADAERRAAEANKRANEEQSYYRNDGVGVTIDGKAGRVFNLALGEYKVGNTHAAANYMQKVLDILSI